MQPPFVNESVTSKDWQGLDNAAWGSHVYFSTVEQYNTIHADSNTRTDRRPMVLTKFRAGEWPVPLAGDWPAGMQAVEAAESPAQHRYPVWWTGDQVPLQGSVQSMVDAGIHGFKPFVHSDW